jgi:uncharacterized protein (DUF58 family)
MRPTQSLLKLLGLLTVLALLGTFWPELERFWIGASSLLFLVALWDALTLPGSHDFEARREMPGRFALGIRSTVRLLVKHHLRRDLRILLHDGLPLEAESEGLPWSGTLPAGEALDLAYDLQFTKRGLHRFEPMHLLANSQLGLWRRLCRVGLPTETQVYPNYEPVLRFALLATANREEQMGIVKRRRNGATLDFHQLREYQDGDVLARVDWKATSRRQNLISRDYEEQKNQSILLVPDCGRRMRAMDGELSQFDHCLNAMLLISYIALRQGDEVGVVGFGGVQRWLQPVKGPSAMPKILNHLYDYETTSQPSDFGEAAERVMACQKRRSLVILLTNLRTEDSADLIKAVRVMQKRHVVLVATLKEAEMEARTSQPISSLHDALTYGALSNYLQQRQQVLEQLRAHRIFTVDETAQNLAVALANQYLDVKAGGLL